MSKAGGYADAVGRRVAEKLPKNTIWGKVLNGVETYSGQLSSSTIKRCVATLKSVKEFDISAVFPGSYKRNYFSKVNKCSRELPQCENSYKNKFVLCREDVVCTIPRVLPCMRLLKWPMGQHEVAGT